MSSLFKKITLEDIHFFKGLIGDTYVLTDSESRNSYGHDETEDLLFPPDIVLRPESTQEISAIMNYCNQEKICVTPRAGGTGLSGGALAVKGGVCLSIDRLNKLIEIDEHNLQATAEPGMITQIFMDLVEEKGLMYPVDPSSKGSCMLGGNLAESSGGPRAVKYGTVRDYVLNMEVVLPNGNVIWTGANTLKYASGYNLTHLLIGSEGTLGIITKIVFKLIPLPKHHVLMLASFPSVNKACEAVSLIFKAGHSPSALEFMEKDGVDWVVRYEQITFHRKENINAFLLIELDGNDYGSLLSESESIANLLYELEVDEVLLADSAQQKEELWRMRRNMSVSVKAHSIYKEEDTVVPRAALPTLLAGVKQIGEKYGFQSVCYGHAGDGNLHINIIKGKLSDEKWNTELKKGITEIFELTVSLGGTLSGEHGIGYVQKEFMPIKYTPVHMDLMQGIKNVFDPNHILNPGKIFS